MKLGCCVYFGLLGSLVFGYRYWYDGCLGWCDSGYYCWCRIICWRRWCFWFVYGCDSYLIFCSWWNNFVISCCFLCFWLFVFGVCWSCYRLGVFCCSCCFGGWWYWCCWWCCVGCSVYCWYCVWFWCGWYWVGIVCLGKVCCWYCYCWGCCWWVVWLYWFCFCCWSYGRIVCLIYCFGGIGLVLCLVIVWIVFSCIVFVVVGCGWFWLGLLRLVCCWAVVDCCGVCLFWWYWVLVKNF